MTNYPADEDARTWAETPRPSRREQAEMDGFDPYEWPMPTATGDLGAALDALANAVDDVRRDRCAVCGTTVWMGWSADSCPGGHLITCAGCDAREACGECRGGARDVEEVPC